MGLLPCDRLDCTEIMCSINVLGNSRRLCGACWNELVQYRTTWDEFLNENQVRDKILDFIDGTSPGDTLPKPPETPTTDEAFRNLTGQPDNYY